MIHRIISCTTEQDCLLIRVLSSQEITFVVFVDVIVGIRQIIYVSG